MAATVKESAHHTRTVKALAQSYAEALVAYHVAQASDRATPETNRRAYNQLSAAQNALNAAALDKALSY